MVSWRAAAWLLLFHLGEYIIGFGSVLFCFCWLVVGTFSFSAVVSFPLYG